MDKRQIIPLALCFMLGMFINGFVKNTSLVVMLAVLVMFVIVKSKVRTGMYTVLIVFVVLGFFRFELSEMNLKNETVGTISSLIGTTYGLEEGEYRKYYFSVDKINVDGDIVGKKTKYLLYTDESINLNGKTVEIKYKHDS